jgi:hypothetical protein
MTFSKERSRSSLCGLSCHLVALAAAAEAAAAGHNKETMAIA